VHFTSALALLPWTLAAVFAAAGIVHLAGPRWLRETYERWDYPLMFQLVVGVFDFAAAALIVVPEFRGLGILLAEAITFFSVVALLSHERYLGAVPAIALMIAMVPTALSIPHHDRYAVYYVENNLVLSAK